MRSAAGAALPFSSAAPVPGQILCPVVKTFSFTAERAENKPCAAPSALRWCI